MLAGAALIAALTSTAVITDLAGDDRASAAPVAFRTYAVPVYKLDRARYPVSRGDRRAMDQVAREWSRALVAVIETCWVESGTFHSCDTPRELDPFVRKLPYGSEPGMVQVLSTGVAQYTVMSWSQSGRRFLTERDDRGRLRHRIDRGGPPPRRWRPDRPSNRVRIVHLEPQFRIAGPRDAIRAHDRLLRERDELAQALAERLVPVVERCRAVTLTFALCDTSAELAPFGATSLPMGTTAGEVSVTTSSVDTFTVAADSRIGNQFRIWRTPSGELIRTCNEAGYAACRADGTW